ncbi:uncharacterized protein LOC133289775 [Gastrolobium bilobum]|uniref:uncharacterized protein LOC133289775 n=1 Tax=Gastrolobium bilobum TaxID=150636 RepID=UPI002AB102B0|nr:uncharacterized protein LOC133289775 [Gastrolobium bilobum]
METETNIQEDASAMGIVLPEGMDKVCAEKEQVDHHSETQSMEEAIIKHTNSEEKMTTESSIKSTYDMGELEKIPESHSIENLSIKYGGNIMPEEAKDIKEATDEELQKSETESDYLLKGVPEDESTSTLPKLAIDQAETAEIGFEKETLEEEESTEIDNNQCCRPQNELEQRIKAFEAIDLPQTMGKDAAENEHTDQQSKATSTENVITKHSYSEGTLTMESSTKLTYDEEEPEKIPESHCVDNPEIKDCGKLMPEKAIDIKEATELELQKSETESVPEDKALSTLPITASVPVEAIVKSIEEEIHKKEESAVTDAEEGQRPEYDFEKTKVPEVRYHRAFSRLPIIIIYLGMQTTKYLFSQI